MATTTLPENPLIAGLERLPVPATTLTIFGATGDLSQRKLLPALYNLAHEGALPERFNLIGTSRSEHTDDEFREIATAAGGDPFNRCFYLSTAPTFFPVIIEALGEAGLTGHDGADVRIVIEK